MMLNKEDFVIYKKQNCDLPFNSVGYVIEIYDNSANVFFISIQAEKKVLFNDIEILDIAKTGKPHKYKICNVCHILKEDFVDFEINQTDSKGRKTTRPSCRECRKKIDGVSLKGAEKKKLEAIKPKQFFICPICEKGSIPGVTANLVKDHDHETGKARDWLCDSCNTGLGRFKDNVELLEKAINYLKKHNN